MKKQMTKKLLITSFCVVVVMLLFSVLAQAPSIAFAATANGIEPHDYDSYTDSDYFTYDGVAYPIQAYELIDELISGNVSYSVTSTGVELDVTQDNAIVKIVPKELFTQVGDYLYVGKEYGFFVHTEKHNPSVNRLSTVVIFDITTGMLDGGVVEVTVEPIIQRQYVYLSESATEYYFRKAIGVGPTGDLNIDKKAQYSITSGKVIPHAEYSQNLSISKFNYDYEVKDYYLKDISYLMTLYNEQSSNEGMPDYVVKNDTGSYFTYFDYKYQGITRIDNELNDDVKKEYILSCVNYGCSLGKAILSFIPGVGAGITIGDAILDTIDFVKDVKNYGLYAKGVENQATKHDVSIDNGTITLENYYANRDDQIKNYGGIIKNVGIIIRTNEDDESIWYTNGNKATGYFKISHSALNMQPIDYTRLIRQIGLSVVRVDGTPIDTQISAYTYMLRSPVYEQLQLSRASKVRLLDNGENYFSFTPQFAGEYKLSIGTGQNIKVTVNNQEVAGVLKDTTRTYNLQLEGGRSYNIQIEALGEGCFGDIVIDAAEQSSHLQAGIDCLVKLTSSETQLKTVSTNSSGVVIKNVYVMNNDNTLSVVRDFEFYTPEASVDMMLDKTKQYYLLLRSSTSKLVQIRTSNPPTFKNDDLNEISLSDGGSYRYFKISLPADSSYVISFLDKTTNTNPDCSIITQVYAANGEKYTNSYMLSRNVHTLTSSQACVVYFGFKAYEDVTLVVSMGLMTNAFNWEVYQTIDGIESVVMEKSNEVIFKVMHDFSQNLYFRAVLWVNKSTPAPLYDLDETVSGVEMDQEKGEFKIYSDCELGVSFDIYATTIDNPYAYYKHKLNVIVKYPIDLKPEINYENAMAVTLPAATNISEYKFKFIYTEENNKQSDPETIEKTFKNGESFYVNFYSILVEKRAKYATLTLTSIRLQDSNTLIEVSDNDERLELKSYVIILDCFTSGDGNISNALQLYNIRHDQSYNRIIVNDIDMQALGYWTPIDVLTCNLGGSSKKILNFKMKADKVDGKYGLVGVNKARITAVNMIGVKITATDSTEAKWSQVGAIAGINRGYISFCRVTGDITVKRSYSDVGCIVGHNDTGATIFLCIAGDYNAAKTNITASGDTGGIAGSNYGDVGVCLTSNVQVAHYLLNIARSIGGVVGYCKEGNIVSCIVEKSLVTNLNTATTARNARMGLVVGEARNSTISYTLRGTNYWNYGNVAANNRIYCFNGSQVYGKVESTKIGEMENITDPV